MQMHLITEKFPSCEICSFVWPAKEGVSLEWVLVVWILTLSPPPHPLCLKFGLFDDRCENWSGAAVSESHAFRKAVIACSTALLLAT